MKWISISVLAAVALAGCGIGNAPQPMEAKDVQAELGKLSPEQQIDWVNRSPMPPEEKKRRIDEIKAKTGYSGPEGAPLPQGGPMSDKSR